MQTVIHLRPGLGFYRQAAEAIWHFLATQSESQQAVLVLPTAVQIPPVREALYQAKSDLREVPRLFLPRIVTLGHWLQDIPPPGGHAAPRSLVTRLLMLQQTLKTQEWLRTAMGAQSEGALWGFAQSIVQLCDELSEVWLAGLAGQGQTAWAAHAEKQLQQALERAYEHLHQRMLGEEAQLVLMFWRLLSSRQDPVPIKMQSLQRLTQRATGPLIWLAPCLPSRLEQEFLQQYAQQQEVLQIGYDWSGSTKNALYATILCTWPECVLSPEYKDDTYEQTAAELMREAEKGTPEEAISWRVLGAMRFEDEAILVAQTLIDWLSDGHRKLALVAQDRIVARRVRALLVRAGVPVKDETGWKLSTTRAAAALMCWLDVVGSGRQNGRTFSPESRVLLDWLKSPFTLQGTEGRGRMTALLEQLIRRRNISGGWAPLRRAVDDARNRHSSDATAIGAAESAEEASRHEVLTALSRLLARLQANAEKWRRAVMPLSGWGALLDESLQALGMHTPLSEDEAGRQLLALLAELHADRAVSAAEAGELTFAEWQALLSLSIEASVYREPAVAGEACVVILPLNGARMRRFDGVVVAGCDDSQLPSQQQDMLFFSNQLRRELGLPDQVARYAQQARDLAELFLNNRQIVCTWQMRANTGEPRRLSGWLLRLLQVRDARSGVPLLVATQKLPARMQTASARMRCPAPAAPELLPTRLSAQAYNMLRRCPYQFFIGRMLRLADLEEVREDLEKREVGAWLHEILLHFHQHLPTGTEREARVAYLQQLSTECFEPKIAQDGNVIRYWQRWQSLIPTYVDWQLKREEEGWHWQAGEITIEREWALPDGGQVILQGRIDRLDSKQKITECLSQKEADATSAVLAVCDYKTQSLSRLRAKQKEVGEDCQLPFYALLQPAIEAGAWVALDGDKVGHCALPDLPELAQWLGRQLQDDLQRIRQGAGLPALGDETSCRYCEARGLCRKGYWDGSPLGENAGNVELGKEGAA